MNIKGNKLARRALSLLVLLTLIAGTVLPSFAQTHRRRTRTRRRTTTVTRTTTPPVRYYTLNADTVIRVRQVEQIGSANARIGDRFSTTVVDPVYADGVEVIPAGSKVWGRVSTIKRAGRSSPGNITVSFNSVEMPNGATYTINGSLTNVDSGNTSSDNEGTVQGQSNRKRDAIFVGGGAAGGAIIGAIAGGGKGAAIGTILGGIAGVGGRKYEKEQEAVVKAGTEYGVVLNRSVSLPQSNVR